MNTLTLHRINTLTSLWQKALDGSLPMALWRLPHAPHKELAIDLSGNTQTLPIDLEELPEGFVVSPFMNPEGQKSQFLKADVYVQFDENEEIIEESSRNIDLFQSLHLETQAGIRPAPVFEESSNDTYTQMVAEAIEEIKKGGFQKVVLSRTKRVALGTNFDFVQTFQALCQKYPSAFVSALFLPEEGCVWLGATPETLVSMNRHGIFKTASLAGTQAATDANGEAISVHEARWSHKEIEEQAFVSRYIIECFKKIRLREYIENGPKTVQAGHLLHLRTDYSVDTRSVNFPQLGTVMLGLLHPTSAVCGMPKEPALAFIETHESHQRQFYSGFLGPVNIGQESHLFVNLRTMQVFENEAILYAGAGITEDSNPKKEWRETELKCQTMLAVLT